MNKLSFYGMRVWLAYVCLLCQPAMATAEVAATGRRHIPASTNRTPARGQRPCAHCAIGSCPDMVSCLYEPKIQVLGSFGRYYIGAYLPTKPWWHFSGEGDISLLSGDILVPRPFTGYFKSRDYGNRLLKSGKWSSDSGDPNLAPMAPMRKRAVEAPGSGEFKDMVLYRRTRTPRCLSTVQGHEWVESGERESPEREVSPGTTGKFGYISDIKSARPNRLMVDHVGFEGDSEQLAYLLRDDYPELTGETYWGTVKVLEIEEEIAVEHGRPLPGLPGSLIQLLEVAASNEWLWDVDASIMYSKGIAPRIRHEWMPDNEAMTRMIARAVNLQDGDPAKRRVAEGWVLLGMRRAIRLFVEKKVLESGKLREDVTQEATLGVLEALRRYSGKGKFLPYAEKYMLGRAYDYMLYDLMQRNGTDLSWERERAKLRRLTTKIAQELGRTPTSEEIAERAECNVLHVETMQMGPTLSLDRWLFTEDDERTFGDTVMYQGGLVTYIEDQIPQESTDPEQALMERIRTLIPMKEEELGNTARFLTSYTEMGALATADRFKLSASGVRTKFDKLTRKMRIAHARIEADRVREANRITEAQVAVADEIDEEEMM